MSFLSSFSDTNKPLALFLVLFVVGFCGMAAVNIEILATLVLDLFSFTVHYFGFYWQILLVINFLICVGLCFHPNSRRRIGKKAGVIFSDIKWCSMILCTLLAAGGVFWAAGEPLFHFLNPSPYYGISGGSAQSVGPALAQSFMHWGFLPWAIMGPLSTIVLMHYHYEKGLPLAPRTLMYPLLGEYATRGIGAVLIDGLCIVAVLAGTVGAIGFYGLQIGQGLFRLFSLPPVLWVDTVAIIVLGGIFTVSAITGLSRGIQILSRLNVYLAVVLCLLLILFDPLFIVSSFFQGFYIYIKNFFQMALYQADTNNAASGEWLNAWTLFFWGWFIGYAPLMSIFIARVSEGRSIRSIILMVAIISPILTCMLFSIMGGTGMSVALHAADSSALFGEFKISSALYTVLSGLPFSSILCGLFLILSTIFVATTGDSMTYVISSCLSKTDHPSVLMRIFFGMSLCAMAIILIYIGEKSISMLQNFILVTAMPVSFIVLPAMWDAIRIVLNRSK